MSRSERHIHRGSRYIIFSVSAEGRSCSARVFSPDRAILPLCRSFGAMAVAKKARTTAKKTENKNAASPSNNGNVTSIDSAQTAAAQDFAEMVRRRAYEIYEQSGRPQGRDREHWLQAEAEIRGQKTA
ncbi:MAG TPA: DUF2934 domain-containing protein [Terriglobales bacterium]|nr:DUF2934 domain-containing protein [Terriglobales bacterium]